mgnify:CR=1 FL=1
MTIATHDDVCRLFPVLDDHAVVDLLANQPSTEELEAVFQMLQDNDESLIEVKRQRGDRLNRLVAILMRAQLEAADDRDR